MNNQDATDRLHEPIGTMDGLRTAGQVIAGSEDEDAVGRELVGYAAAGTADVARLLVFAKVSAKTPAALNTRPGWTVARRSIAEHESRLGLADQMLREFFQADAPFVCENVALDQRLNEPARRILNLVGVASFASLPLTTGRAWLGALVIGRGSPGRFDDDMIHGLWTLAGIAAFAIKNARLQKESLLLKREPTLIPDTNATASAPPDLDQVLHATAYQLSRALAADGCTMLSLDRSRNALITLLASSNDPGPSEHQSTGTICSLSDYPLFEKAIATRQALIVQANDRNLDPVEAKRMNEQGVQSWLIAPLICDDQPAGLLELSWAEEWRDFASTEIALCQMVANQLAVTLSNALLIEQLRRPSRPLMAAADISRAASVIHDPHALMDSVAGIVCDRFSLHSVGIFLTDATGKWAVLEAASGDAGGRISAGRHRIEVGGNSVVGRCIGNGQTCFALDLAQEAVTTANTASANAQSEIALPLISRGQVLGAIAIQSARESVFSEDDLAALQTIADQTASALRNAALHDESRLRLHELTLLLETSATLASSLDANEALRITAKQIAVAMAVSVCSISMWDRQNDTVVRTIDCSVRNGVCAVHEEGVVFLLKDYPLLRQVLIDRIPVLTAESAGEHAPGAHAWLIDRPVFSALTVPLIVRDDVMGVLSLIDNDSKRMFTQAEVGLCQALANQVAVVLENTRLIQQARRSTRELSMLFEVSQQLATSLLKPEEIARVLAERLAGMGDLQFSLSLLEHNGQQMRVLADCRVKDDGSIVQEATDELLAVSTHPVAEKVLATMCPLVIQFDELDADPSYSAYMRGQNLATLAMFPLSVKGKSIGVMELKSRERHEYTIEQSDLIMTLGNQAARALENRILLERTQAALIKTEILARELGVLNDLGQALSACANVEQVLREVHRGASRLLDTSGFFVGLTDSNTEQIDLVLDADVSPVGVKDNSASARDVLTQYTARERKSLLLNRGTAQYRATLGSKAVADEPISWISVPLTLGDRLLGVMGVQSRSEQVVFDEHDRELLTAVASQAAIAILNAQLFEETQVQARREHTLRQVIASINASDDLVADLPMIGSQLRQIVPFNGMSLVSITPGETEFNILCEVGGPVAIHSISEGYRAALEDTAPGWVLANGAPLIDHDIRKWQRFGSDTGDLDAGYVSRLILPLRTGDRILGTLNLASTSDGAYSESVVGITAQVADQLAMALDRARLLEETRTALDEVQAMHRRYLRTEWAALLSSQPAQRWSYVSRRDGLTPTTAGETLEPEQQSLAPYAFEANETTGDVLPAPYNRIAVPIRLRGEVIGMMEFSDNERVWTKNEAAMVRELANNVALALENQRLFDHSQRRAHRERLAGEIVGKIRSAGDVHDIIETAAKELGQALGVSHTRVRIGDPTGENLDIKSHRDEKTNDGPDST